MRPCLKMIGGGRKGGRRWEAPHSLQSVGGRGVAKAVTLGLYRIRRRETEHDVDQQLGKDKRNCRGATGTRVSSCPYQLVFLAHRWPSECKTSYLQLRFYCSRFMNNVSCDLSWPRSMRKRIPVNRAPVQPNWRNTELPEMVWAGRMHEIWKNPKGKKKPLGPTILILPSQEGRM